MASLWMRLSALDIVTDPQKKQTFVTDSQKKKTVSITFQRNGWKLV